MAVIKASRPNFKNPSDKIAFAVHAAFLAAGYSLIATGAKAFAENPPTDGDEVGIEGWNDLEDGYAFVYLKSVKGEKKPILVKCLSIGDALVVDVLNLKEENKAPFHVQINVKDFLSEGDSSNYGEMYKNMQGLVDNLNSWIFYKIEPKPESSSSGSSASRSGETSTNEPAGTFPIGRTQPPPQLGYPPIPMPGGGDLLPGPGAGVFPHRGPGTGGSMFVGPNDPRWFGGGAPGTNFPGGDLIPPGARYDPIGPPDVPGFGPEHFIRGPPRRPGLGGDIHPDLEPFRGGPPRRPGQGGDVHPDLEHFRDSDFI